MLGRSVEVGLDRAIPDGPDVLGHQGDAVELERERSASERALNDEDVGSAVQEDVNLAFDRAVCIDVGVEHVVEEVRVGVEEATPLTCNGSIVNLDGDRARAAILGRSLVGDQRVDDEVDRDLSLGFDGLGLFVVNVLVALVLLVLLVGVARSRSPRAPADPIRLSTSPTSRSWSWSWIKEKRRVVRGARSGLSPPDRRQTPECLDRCGPDTRHRVGMRPR